MSTETENEVPPRARSGLGRAADLWSQTPLYLRIVGALLLGALVGYQAGPSVAGLREVSGLVLALLRALATPLILLAILHALLATNIGGKTARRMVFFL